MSRRNDTTPVPADGYALKLVISQSTRESLRSLASDRRLVVTSLVRDLLERAVADPKKYFPKNSIKGP